MKSFSYVGGAMISLLCAGPVFWSAIWLGSSLTTQAEGQSSLAFSYLSILPAAWIAGAIVGAIPITLGGFIMGHLGSDAPRSRHYAIWGIAGAITALPMPIMLGVPAMWETLSLFAFTGAVCALLVRFGTYWDDETPPAPTRMQEGEVK